MKQLSPNQNNYYIIETMIYTDGYIAAKHIGYKLINFHEYIFHYISDRVIVFSDNKESIQRIFNSLQ